MQTRAQWVLMAGILMLCVGAFGGLAGFIWNEALRAFSRSEVPMGGVSIATWPRRFILRISFAMASAARLWIWATDPGFLRKMV